MDETDFNEGLLECNVDKPQKENDGTKDAYISYRVTTRVSLPINRPIPAASPLCLGIHCKLTLPLERLSVIPAFRILRQATLHRLCVPLEDAQQRVSTMRRPAAARQTQDGVRPWRSLRARLHPTESKLAAALSQEDNAAPGAAPLGDIAPLP